MVRAIGAILGLSWGKSASSKVYRQTHAVLAYGFAVTYHTSALLYT